MRRMLALGLAGEGSLLDVEDDRRFGVCFGGEAPLIAASKNSRSLRLRNICVGVPRVVKCWCVTCKEGIPLGVFGWASILG